MLNWRLTLTIIIILAAFLRLYGLNWDQGAHLHPDERFLTMVTNSLKWPASFSQYLDPITSPLNPANAGYPFFVYGTFPLFFVKALAAISGMDDYNNLTLLGRAVSALFDLGTLYLVFAIAKTLISKSQQPATNYQLPILAAFFYAASVLPIQLSHFFAVDTFLVFFLTLSFYLLTKLLFTLNAPTRITNYELRITTLLGIAYGLALASKISALLFLPIILLGVFFRFLLKRSPYSLGYWVIELLGYLFTICLFAYLSFRIANPYAFTKSNLLNPTISPLFLQNLKTLKSFEGAESSFPPAIQWLTSEPLLFPLRNMLYYGLGIPLGILAVGGFFYTLFYLLSYLKKSLNENLNKRYLYTRHPIDNQICRFHYRSIIILLLIVLWVGGLFFYQGTQFVKAMRYFAPIYPFLAILAAFFASQVLNHQKTPQSGALAGTPPGTGLLELSTKFLITQKVEVVKSQKRGVDPEGVEPSRPELTAPVPPRRGPTPKLIITTTNFLVKIIFVGAILIWPLSFIAIYARPHSRIAASFWIYQNIPEGSTLTCEHWDDCLPLPITTVRPWYFGLNKPQNRSPTSVIKSYKTLELPLYDPDTAEKWEKISQTLKQADYIILSSNRLFGSIPSVPERYPLTTQFYAFLFAEKLGFKKVAEFTSRPHLPFPFKICLQFSGESYGYYAHKGNPCEADKGLTLVDDSADESFTVYDHPKVIIFKKTRCDLGCSSF